MRLLQEHKSFLFIFSFILFNSCIASAILIDNPNLPLVKNDPTVISFNNATANVNSSDEWNTNLGSLSNANSTQFENNGGTLSIIPSWLTSFIQALTGGNIFDQSLNTTDNVTFNRLDIVSNGDGVINNHADIDDVNEDDNSYFNGSQDAYKVQYVVGLTGTAGQDPEGNSVAGADRNSFIIHTFNDGQNNQLHLAIDGQSFVTLDSISSSERGQMKVNFNSIVPVETPEFANNDYYYHVVNGSENDHITAIKTDSHTLASFINGTSVSWGSVTDADFGLYVNNGANALTIDSTTEDVTIKDHLFVGEGLNVTDNASASFFIGDGSYLTGVLTGNPFDQSLNTTDNVIFNNVTINGNLSLSPDTKSFIFTDRGSSLALQKANAGEIFRFEQFTADGDGSDDNIFSIYGLGTPEDVASHERLTLMWDNSSAVYRILMEESGAGGSIKPIEIGMDGYENMLRLNTNGNISMNQSLDVVENITASYFIGDGSQLTGIGTSNPFDQSLNTTDNVTFDYLNLSGELRIKTLTGTARDSVLQLKQNGNERGIFFQESGGNEGFELAVNTDGDFEFWNAGAGTPIMTLLDSSNFVGIGKTPTVALDVIGTGQLSGNLRVNGGDIGITGDTDLMQLASGILKVNGDLNVTDDIYGGGDLFFAGATDVWVGAGQIFTIGSGTVAFNRHIDVAYPYETQIGWMAKFDRGNTEGSIQSNDDIFTRTQNGFYTDTIYSTYDSTRYMAVSELLSNATDSKLNLKLGSKDAIPTMTDAFVFDLLTGDLQVTGDIGITTDTDLISLATNSITLNGETTLSPDSVEKYIIGDRGNHLTFRNNVSGELAGWEYFSADGDGTDNVYHRLYGLGTESSVANHERLFMGWDATDSAYRILMEESGTGVTRPLILGINGTDDMLWLKTDGNINMSGNLDVANNITLGNGGTLWGNSTCTFLASPDGSGTLEVCNA